MNEKIKVNNNFNRMKELFKVLLGNNDDNVYDSYINKENKTAEDIENSRIAQVLKADELKRSKRLEEQEKSESISKRSVQKSLNVKVVSTESSVVKNPILNEEVQKDIDEPEI